MYDETKADIASYEEDEESESSDINENYASQSEEDEEDEESRNETEVSNMANYILEEELVNTRENFSPESLSRLQTNVRHCVDAWELWNPTTNFEMLLKKSIDFAAKK